MLFGVGLGFIIASFLMFLVGSFTPKLSPAEIELAARELGMVYRYEVLALEEEEREEEALLEESKEKSQEDLDKTPEPSVTEPPPEKVLVRIVPGSTPQEIAALLKSQGVIAQEEEFLQVVYARKLQRKLRAGYFELPLNISPEEVLKYITNQQEGGR